MGLNNHTYIYTYHIEWRNMYKKLKCWKLEFLYTCKRKQICPQISQENGYAGNVFSFRVGFFQSRRARLLISFPLTGNESISAAPVGGYNSILPRKLTIFLHDGQRFSMERAPYIGLGSLDSGHHGDPGKRPLSGKGSGESRRLLF